VDRGPEQSRVDISGEASSVVPFLHMPVRTHAVGPSERFVGNVYGFAHSAFSSGRRSVGGTQ
jgi:hypothetical protein